MSKPRTPSEAEPRGEETTEPGLFGPADPAMPETGPLNIDRENPYFACGYLHRCPSPGAKDSDITHHNPRLRMALFRNNFPSYKPS